MPIVIPNEREILNLLTHTREETFLAKNKGKISRTFGED